MNVMVVEAHSSNYPNPIAFEPGHLLRLGRLDDEFPGWIWVTTPDGNEGWAPVQLIHTEPTLPVGKAIQAYSARELNTNQGEILTVLEEMNRWYRVRRQTGEVGWVPVKTVRPID